MRKIVCWLRGHRWTDVWWPDADSSTLGMVMCARCAEPGWRT